MLMPKRNVAHPWRPRIGAKLCVGMLVASLAATGCGRSEASAETLPTMRASGVIIASGSFGAVGG